MEMRNNSFGGKLVAIDGPNGVGKSTIIEAVAQKLQLHGIDVFTTKEPTATELGLFVRGFAEKEKGRVKMEENNNILFDL